MPWSPTQAFAHPLANIQKSSADTSLTNYASYVLVEMMTWQAVGNVINSFRRKTLELERIDLSWAPGMLARLKLPHTYLWSVLWYSGRNSLELIPLQVTKSHLKAERLGLQYQHCRLLLLTAKGQLRATYCIGIVHSRRTCPRIHRIRIDCRG